ncbi:MAG: hypothetical protein QY304_00450 [Candidatus Paceibacterota bacterium]|nr:MAG: hypothetical protein QY304_00450 [Candidatus Paceibacterota bacterium]
MTRNRIINAPSKFDLSIAFFDRPNPEQLGGRRSVTFTIEGPSCPNGQRQIEVVINHISWEDGSGESWCFEGYCKTDVGQPQNSTAEVKGWFRTSDRKGWINIDASAQSNTSGTAGQGDSGLRNVIDQIATQRNQ